MKIILTQDVKSLGVPGDLVEVADGYARNYLVPQGFAIVATKGAEKQVATIRRSRELKDVRDQGQAKDIAAQLGALSVVLPARAGDGGRLFGSVTTADLVAAVTKAGGPKLDKRRVELTAPIKNLGTHTFTIRLHTDIEATVSVDVVKAQ